MVDPQTPVPPPSTARSFARWWKAVALGAALCVPIGWLLSYAGGLPCNLGLFFYMLLGVLVSAVLYRVGQAARPIPLGRLRIGLGLVVLIGWGVSMWVEAHEFPKNAADKALNRFRQCPPGMTPDVIKQGAIEFVHRHLREAYPPGGAIGYYRWALTRSDLAVEIDGVPIPVRLRFAANRGWLAFRVAASLALFLYAVRSQVRTLRNPTDRPARAPAPAETPTH